MSRDSRGVLSPAGAMRRWACACLLALPGLLSAAPAPAQGTAAQPARGLIVKLKDAPANAELESRQSLRTGERERAMRVLSAAALGAPALRPVGRAAQLVDFGRVLPGEEAQRLAQRLRAQPEVEWVVPNVREKRLQAAPVVPDDEFYPSSSDFDGQWWLYPPTGANANELGQHLRGVPGFQTAWRRTVGLPSAVVAVLDSGITRHPDLDAHVLPGFDFVADVPFANDGNGRDADPSDPGDWVSQQDADRNDDLFSGCQVEDSSWHGTIIAGLIAAVTNNATGVAGMNWNGRVVPVRVAGKCGAEVADIIDGMRWAAGLPVAGAPANPNPARIINISFGSSEPCNAAYQSTINELLTQKGAVVVAAAGNASSPVVNRPGSCSGAISVAALNSDGFKTDYSSFGTGVTVSTVGGDPGGMSGAQLGDGGLLTVDNTGLRSPDEPTYSYVFGTSFSAPVVSGTISLMLSANPQLSAAQIVDGLRRTARPHVDTPQALGACSAQNPGRCLCTASTCGPGILDTDQAVLYAQNPASLDDGGGGGALGLGWLAGLGLAIAALARRRG